MQYLLSQEEKDALVSLEDLKQSKAAIVHLRQLVVGDKCVALRTKNSWEYCDDCPCSMMNSGGDYRLSKTMCDLYRNYSK